MTTTWHSAVQVLFGTAALALVTWLCYRLRLSLATAAFASLIVVVLLSLTGSFIPLILSIFAIGLLSYFFAPLANGLQVEETVELVAFSITSLVVIGLVRRGRTLAGAALDAQQSVREQAGLLDLTHDTVFVRDMNDRITYWNRGAEELYGWRSAEAIGKVTHQLLQTTFPEPLEQITDAVVRSGRWEGELVHTKRDGTRVVVASRWALRQDEQGRPVAILETNNDVTDQALASEALGEAQAQLAHITRVTTLGEVTASLAHEVNQPLAAIVNNANACLELTPGGRDLDEVREALADIVRDGERASAIIERVRGLARRSPPEKVPLRLADVVADVLALAAAESATRNVAIRTDVGPDLPVVLGDRVQLQQVLLNLVVNGMDAMSAVAEGERRLEIRGRADSQEGSPAALLSVEDRGIGLEAGQADSIFDAFYTTKPHGMGMGLAISRSIIEAHGGRLWAQANHGPGATFAFSLPAAAAGAAP